MIKVQVSGVKELKDKIDSIREQSDNFLELTSERVMVNFKTEAVRRAPYKRGTLRRSIGYVKIAVSKFKTVYQLGADMPYARITEFGGMISPKNKPFLAWYDPSSPYAAKEGKFRGFVFTKKPIYRQAKPFMVPAMLANQEKWVRWYYRAFIKFVVSGTAKNSGD